MDQIGLFIRLLVDLHILPKPLVWFGADAAVPRELEEAAVIDGCNSLQLLWWVFLPSVIPGIVSVALFAFLTSWNEFIGALIFMNKETMFTLPIMLVASRTGYYGSGLMSGAVK